VDGSITPVDRAGNHADQSAPAAVIVVVVDGARPDTRLLYGLIRAAASDGHTLDTLHVLTGIPRDELAAIVAAPSAVLASCIRLVPVSTSPRRPGCPCRASIRSATAGGRVHVARCHDVVTSRGKHCHNTGECPRTCMGYFSW
jgi:hypothetical protein